MLKPKKGVGYGKFMYSAVSWCVLKQRLLSGGSLAEKNKTLPDSHDWRMVFMRMSFCVGADGLGRRHRGVIIMTVLNTGGNAFCAPRAFSPKATFAIPLIGEIANVTYFKNVIVKTRKRVSPSGLARQSSRSPSKISCQGSPCLLSSSMKGSGSNSSTFQTPGRFQRPSMNMRAPMQAGTPVV